MSGGVFLLHDDGRLDEVREQPYSSEDLLQDLLARYPHLLAGDQMDGAAPRRWLLVAREVGVPGEEGGADRWALDHLFLDQDGVPTLVEVKRSSDTRIRRAVVGQMLDYAANAVLHWPPDRVQARFEARCQARGEDPAVALAEFLGGSDAAAFWQAVKTNLQAGRVRMVFVADAIPDELRRVVEFLNAQMDPAEVLAIEIRQYAGKGTVRTLVPKVVGQTAASGRRKSGATPKQEVVGEDVFLAAVREALDPPRQAVVVEAIAWAKRLGFGMHHRQGTTGVTFIPVAWCGRKDRYPVSFGNATACRSSCSTCVTPRH
jgi:hypothetical protein